jgi:hypothetical protein
MGGVSSLLSSAGIANPLSGVSPGSFSGGLSSGSIAGLASQFKSADNYYLPQNGEGGLLGTLVNNRADMISNLKAAATTLFNGSQQRITALQDLKARVETTTTLKEAQDLNNEIAAAESDINNQQGQMQQLASLANMEQQQADLNAQQAQIKSAKGWYDSTQALP